jgi:hypothetical protein
MTTPLFQSFWEHIKTKRLIDLTLPGTHDSGASNFLKQNPIANTEQFPNVYYPIVFRIVPGLFSGVVGASKAQTLTIDEQLTLGIKSFDLRVGLYNNVLTLNHTFPCANSQSQPLTLDSVLQNVNDYLKKNPFEFLLLNITPNSVKSSDNTSAIKSQIQDLCLKYFPVSKLITTSELQSSSLETLKNLDKRLGIFGIDDNIHPMFISTNLYRNSWINTSDPDVKEAKSLTQYNTSLSGRPLYNLDWTLTPQSDDVKNMFKYKYSCTMMKNDPSLLELENNRGFNMLGLKMFLKKNNINTCKFQGINVDGANADFISIIKDLWTSSFAN